MDDLTDEQFEPEPITAADVGRDVYAIVELDPFALCYKCGAPLQRCWHNNHWGLVDVAGIVSGRLVSITEDKHRAEAAYVVEGAGVEPPIAVLRTEDDAKRYLRANYPDPLRLLAQWAGGIVG